MFKVRMQGQYGAAGDKKLSAVFWDMWKDWGFRRGVMRGFWVRASITLHRFSTIEGCLQATVAREIPAYAGYITFTYGYTKSPNKCLM